MLKEKILELRSEITKKQTAINTKIKEAQQRAEEDNLEEAKTIKDEITSLKAEIETMTAKLKDLEELAGMKQEEVTEGEERAFNPRSPKVNFTDEIEEMRSKVNDYIRSYGQTRDGLKTIDAEPVIPVEILTTPQREPEDVVDLASMVNKKPVKTASGTYPVIANAKVGLASVAELEKNPELGKPEFKKVRYDVETYRGELPISQESIDDAGVDLTALVAEFLQQTKLITTNRAVAAVIKTFTKKTVADTDGIKQILNVDLKQAYKRNIVATASAFQHLDTLKDKNGQYILQQSIASPSGKTLFGNSITVMDDEVLGSKAGDMMMFIGDLKAAIFFADRVDVTAKWVENSVYGQVLSIATRFDVKQADEKAGFFVTIKPPVETGTTE
ncbi:phage major capsid protein [Bacillus altitudinis]|uniref:Capsid protein n=1 Tax=Bacillus altitudinis TaxID=293387 RepID=A0A653R7H2_BACAB|nr:phage major capsid protein [Bacillus altitudinis]NQD50990.1 phage major capsid protein [Bacillus altitudinis]WEZ72381.1 phage major capsid protein [Bacillus altitudinis]VXB49526.1 Capsid protein [Bacillus altitudinis]